MKRLLIAVLLSSAISAASAQMTPAQKAVFEDRLTGWVRAYYPQLLNAKGLDDRTMVAFVVDANDHVLDHARGLQPIYSTPTPLVAEVKRMLPKWTLAKFSDHGGACFGNPKDGSKYCVIYGALGK